MNYISNKYKDFISNENRDEEFNAKLFSESNLQIYQVNTNLLLELVFLNYEMCLIQDFNNKKKYYKYFVYYYKLVYFYWRIDKTNFEIKKMLYHTLKY